MRRFSLMSVDPTPGLGRVIVAGGPDSEQWKRAFVRHGYETALVPPDQAVAAIDERVEAVVVDAPKQVAMAICARVKTRFQVPLLPVLVLQPRPARLPQEMNAPDAWLPPTSRPRDVVARVEELIRIRRAERELARLNVALATLAADNGRLYERARRDAEATALLLRELQHRVRNNLAGIQALLILERHREPPRALHEAIDVAIARLRSMAALQDSLCLDSRDVDVAALARAVAQSALDVFGSGAGVQCQVRGDAVLPARLGSAVAIALNELITNALKHAHARHVEVDILRHDSMVELVVVDDGCGIPAEPHAGSGLRIVQAVVANELGGRLRIASRETGTRAEIELPVQTARAAHAVGDADR